MSDTGYEFMIGKRILVAWTPAARKNDADWWAWRVLDVNKDGFWCQGVDSPCRSKHDGTKHMINFNEILDWVEWKEQ